MSALGRLRHDQSRVRCRVRYLLLMLMVGVVSSCAVVDRFADHSVEYNMQAEAIKNQNLLNNIIRSAYRKPLQFTDLVAVTGQVSISGTGAFTVPFGGPRTGFIFSPGATTSDSPIFNLSVLNTKEFYQGILAPIKAQIISYYLSQGFPSRLFLTLLISEIEEGTRPRLTKYYNVPGWYQDFARELDELIDNALTVRPIDDVHVLGPPLRADEVKKLDIAKLDAQNITIVQRRNSAGDFGLQPSVKALPQRDVTYYQLQKSETSYVFCFEATDRNTTDTCNKKEGINILQTKNNRMQAGIHALTFNGRNIILNIRSVEGVIYYLGEWAREQLFPTGKASPPAKIGDKSRCGGADTLFQIAAGPGEFPSISTSYQGIDYHISVDPSGCDRSSQVMELVLQLLALNNSAKDLPSPAVLPVLTH